MTILEAAQTMAQALGMQDQLLQKTYHLCMEWRHLASITHQWRELEPPRPAIQVRDAKGTPHSFVLTVMPPLRNTDIDWINKVAQLTEAKMAVR